MQLFAYSYKYRTKNPFGYVYRKTAMKTKIIAILNKLGELLLFLNADEDAKTVEVA